VVKWKTICRSKNRAGLGVKDLMKKILAYFVNDGGIGDSGWF
jgi:hypothetical protein